MQNYPEKIEILNPQPTEQTPYIVKDYPWGFRLRTQQRNYVETVEGRGKGQRWVTQTQDPKTGRWCAPKKSIYSEIVILYKNLENGHIEPASFSPTYTDEKDLAKFLQSFPLTIMSEYQKKQTAIAIAIYRTRKHLKITTVTNPSAEETKRIEENNKKTDAELSTVLGAYAGEELGKMGLTKK